MKTDFEVGDLVMTKQFPNCPLLIRRIDTHGCDKMYIVNHAGYDCYLLESDLEKISRRGSS